MLFIGDRFVVTVRRGEATRFGSAAPARARGEPRSRTGRSRSLHAVMDSIVDNYLVDRRASSDRTSRRSRSRCSPARTGVDAERRSTGSSARCWSSAGPACRSPARCGSSRRVPAAPAQRRCALLLPRRRRPPAAGHRPHRRPTTGCSPTCCRRTWPRSRCSRTSDMRKISAWVAIAAVPTMIAGIYGMNFQNMPELSASVHSAARSSSTATSSCSPSWPSPASALYRAFKRSGWL